MLVISEHKIPSKQYLVVLYQTSGHVSFAQLSYKINAHKMVTSM